MNKETEKLNGRKNTSIELFEHGTLSKNELANRVKNLNEEIE